MFELFPFTNFHDLNLDWIIKTMKILTGKLETWESTLKEAVESVLEDHPEWTPIGLMSISNDDIDDLINNSGYYKEITMTRARLYNTDCYFTYVPKLDENGEIIKLYVADGGALTPLEYADKNYTSLTINASLGFEIGGVWQNPIIIGDGVILNNNPITNPPEDYVYIGFTDDRTIMEWDGRTVSDASTFLNAGCTQVFDAFYKIVNAGAAIDVNTLPPNTMDKNPRQGLGVKSNGDIVIVTCDGRTPLDDGITMADLQTIMISQGCDRAWNLDGGGSASTSLYGIKINRNIDGNGTIDRHIQYTLNAKKGA